MDGQTGNGGLGEDIVACRRFLKQVHTQVAALLRSLDGLMADHRWTPTNQNVTWGIGPALDPDRWLVDHLYRYYHPQSAARDRIVGVFIYLELPDAGQYTAPVCLVFAAKFGHELKGDVNKGWDTDDIMGVLSGNRALRALTQEECKGFIPGVAAAFGATIPLCELTCEDDLRTRIVAPLLAAECLSLKFKRHFCDTGMAARRDPGSIG